jgi:hypothetical protein
VLNVPNTYKHALVYLSGLERAVALQYPCVQFQLKRQLDGQILETTNIFEYSDGHIRNVNLSRAPKRTCFTGPRLSWIGEIIHQRVVEKPVF